MGPSFSIITVCLNESESIRATCESIVSQVCSDFEWIVIDGASTDGTLDILSEYEDKISCLVSEPDDGVYDAMNKGIKHASGKYVLFLNGGDWLYTSQALQHVSEAPARDLIYGDLSVLNESGEQTVLSYPDSLESGYFLHRGLPHQATFIRRDLFGLHGGYDTAFEICADSDLFMRLVLTGNVSYAHVPQVFSVFSWGGISSSGSVRHKARRIAETHQLKKKHYPAYRFSRKALETEFKLRFRYKKYL